MVSGLIGSGLDAAWLTSHPANVLRVSLDEVAEVSAQFLAPRRLVTVAVGDAEKVTAPLAGILEVE
jgi:hypothetical protein